VERFLLGLPPAEMADGDNEAMKIYFLLMIISVFVGFSYIPLRSEAKPSTTSGAVRPDSMAA